MIEHFWYFINERHSIYLKRLRGEPKPWTDDSILQNFKFTNVFRELDTGTVWLRENFLEPYRDADLRLVAFNICWYRAFNWRGTGALLGWQTDWKPEVIKNILMRELASGRQVFTGAHIIRSEFNRPKVDSIVDVCSDLYDLCRHELLEHLQKRTLQAGFEALLQIPYIGPFQAYEMVTDMRHTRLLEDATDILTWANAGPGAKRGLQRLGLPFKKTEEALESMRHLLNQQDMKRLSYVPSLEIRDVEHSLCEFWKWIRAKEGGEYPRSRYAGAA